MKSIWTEERVQSCGVIHSRRKYGEPKLVTPKELRGVKQAFSVSWIYKKCSCPCFITGNDVWVKHRDFDSQELYNLAPSKPPKFVYNDSFGCVVLRGEAWLVLQNVITDIRNSVFPLRIWEKLAMDITGEYGSPAWERFFARIVLEMVEKTNE